MQTNKRLCLAAALCLGLLLDLSALPATAKTARFDDPLVPLLIGSEENWAPFSHAVNNQPTGMAVDLVRAIFAEAGISIQRVSLPYARCLAETKAGHLETPQLFLSFSRSGHIAKIQKQWD